MKKFFSVTLITLCLIALPVLAQNNPESLPAGQSAINGLDVTANQAGLAQEGQDSPDISQIIGMLINALLGLVGVIFLLIIIMAGFRGMTAGGNEETISQSKKNLTNAVIGLIIIFAAFIITNFVVFTLLDITINL